MSKEDIFENSKKKYEKESLLEGFKNINSLDLEKIDFEDLEKKIKENIHLFPFHKYFLPKGSRIYRARMNNDYVQFAGKIIFDKSIKKSFNNLSQISNRKAEEITEYGRANVPGVSSFYCSTNAKLACIEVIQNVKHSFDISKEMIMVTVGEWITNKTIILAPLFYSNKVIDNRSDISNYVKANNEYMKKSYTDNSVEIHDLVMSFFCDQFAKKEIKSHNDYKISAYYSKIALEMSRKSSEFKYDGILYPSVASSFKGDNISLFDNDLNSKIELKNVYKLMCLNFNFETEIPKMNVVKLAEMESINEKGEFTMKNTF